MIDNFEMKILLQLNTKFISSILLQCYKKKCTFYRRYIKTVCSLLPSFQVAPSVIYKATTTDFVLNPFFKDIVH